VRYELVETRTDTGKVDFKGKPDDAISKEMRKLLDQLNIYRPRVNFYALRHTFETVGGGSRGRQDYAEHLAPARHDHITDSPT